MKTYLKFSIEGDITEFKIKDKILDPKNFPDFPYVEFISNSNKNFIILYNNTDTRKNLTYLPFYNKNIYGDFLFFCNDSNNEIKSITSNKFLNLINISKNNLEEDYSSDDFNLSD